MAKRRIRQSREVGLEPNNLCSHCNRKVRKLIQLETGYFIEHWWSKVVCKNMSEMGMAEKLIEAQLKKHRYIIKGVVNEPIIESQ